jgi:hypothetical protein
MGVAVGVGVNAGAFALLPPQALIKTAKAEALTSHAHEEKKRRRGVFLWGISISFSACCAKFGSNAIPIKSLE